MSIAFSETYGLDDVSNIRDADASASAKTYGSFILLYCYVLAFPLCISAFGVFRPRRVTAMSDDGPAAKGSCIRSFVLSLPLPSRENL